MKYLATVVVLAAACVAGALPGAGCTAHNPDYTGSGGGGGGGGGGGAAGGDLAGVVVDLAGAPVDLSGPLGPCSAGQRQCSGTVASDRCEGGMFVVDRVCPPASSCAETYCAPPPPQLGTQIGKRCDANGGAQQLQCLAQASAMLSCQPFVNPSTKDVRWFCDTAAGPGLIGAHCTKNTDCASGICVTATGICFTACQNDDPDCRTSATATLMCRTMQITVEGVTTTVKGCTP